MTLRVKMIVEKTKIKLSLYELYKIMAESDPIKGVFRQYDCVKLYGFPPETIWAYSWKFDSYEPILRFIKKKTLEELGFEPESCGLRIKIRKPGTGVPVHIDPFEDSSFNPRFEGRDAHRWVVQCSDWDIGQFCQVEDDVMTHWKVGDAYKITKNMRHLACNFSNSDRLLITLTGFTSDTKN